MNRITALHSCLHSAWHHSPRFDNINAHITRTASAREGYYGPCRRQAALQTGSLAGSGVAGSASGRQPCGQWCRRQCLRQSCRQAALRVVSQAGRQAHSAAGRQSRRQAVLQAVLQAGSLGGRQPCGWRHRQCLRQAVLQADFSPCHRNRCFLGIAQPEGERGGEHALEEDVPGRQLERDQ